MGFDFKKYKNRLFEKRCLNILLCVLTLISSIVFAVLFLHTKITMNLLWFGILLFQSTVLLFLLNIKYPPRLLEHVVHLAGITIWTLLSFQIEENGRGFITDSIARLFIILEAWAYLKLNLTDWEDYNDEHLATR